MMRWFAPSADGDTWVSGGVGQSEVTMHEVDKSHASRTMCLSGRCTVTVIPPETGLAVRLRWRLFTLGAARPI
jgi:hypothetical protein